MSGGSTDKNTDVRKPLLISPLFRQDGLMTAAPAALRFDEDRCYDALVSRDRRFDGQFIAAITSTGIYCRPSCPAPVRPKKQNVRIFATAAAAQQAGFRSCKRCRPDAAPGSPEWDLRGDLVGRAMRMIERGEVDRVGVGGVAAQLFISERHLNRIVNDALGASPVALARAQRANLARVLLETTTMPVTDTAFAAGFSSVRQFNDTMRAVYDRTPSEIRKARKTSSSMPKLESNVELRLWLPAREPIDHSWMFGFLADHGLPGISSGTDSSFERTLRLSGGNGHVQVVADKLDHAGVWATFTLEHISDLSDAIARVRRLFDLDADPHHIDETLGTDPVVGPLRRQRPGIRVPGSVDGFEAAIGAIVGQQISVAGARTMLGRIVTAANHDVEEGSRALFPSPDELAELNLATIGLTNARQRTIRSLTDAVRSDGLVLDMGVDRAETRAQLLALPGIGPWTTDVIAMRALGDTDVMLASDLIVKRRLDALAITNTDHLAPWRSYAACTLWATR
jgi:AraC family transcriptional regulator of adaptative response / DNA-3-methyladenine glycosylase II